MLKPLPPEKIETDPETGAEIYRLSSDSRRVDNIYGEQPYASLDGKWITMRAKAHGDLPSELWFYHLETGERRSIVSPISGQQPFHGWSDYFYFIEKDLKKFVLWRLAYGAEAESKEEVFRFPITSQQSTGTVSMDGRYFAACRKKSDGQCEVWSVDLHTGKTHVVFASDRYQPKHEQFARDGSNRLMIQCNGIHVGSRVELMVVNPDGSGDPVVLSLNPPHTHNRPTGHEAWAGPLDEVILSCHHDPRRQVSLWYSSPQGIRPAWVSRIHCGHVTASMDGEFWAGDAIYEKDLPLFVGHRTSGKARRLCFSRTPFGDPMVPGFKGPYTQDGHTHLYFTADLRWIIFSACWKESPSQVYGVRLPEGFLESLR